MVSRPRAEGGRSANVGLRSSICLRRCAYSRQHSFPRIVCVRMHAYPLAHNSSSLAAKYSVVPRHLAHSLVVSAQTAKTGCTFDEEKHQYRANSTKLRTDTLTLYEEEPLEATSCPLKRKTECHSYS